MHCSHIEFHNCTCAQNILQNYTWIQWEKPLFWLISSALDSGWKSVRCDFLSFELTWIGLRNMAEFLTVPERARRRCKGPICYGCRAPSLLNVRFGKCTESRASSSGSATGMSRKGGRIVDWRETQQPGARQNSSFLQFLSAACVFQSVRVATVTPCARWCINAWMLCKIPN